MKTGYGKVKRFAPQHFGIGPGGAWVERQNAQKQEATKLSREITAILGSPAHGIDSIESLFWRLVEATLEMARKIEELERKVDGHHDSLMALYNPGEF